jgi:hypothetical protein
VAKLTGAPNNISPTQIPAKIEGLAFGSDVTIGGVVNHTLYVANDNDFVPDVAGPSRWYVFAFTDADLAAISNSVGFTYTPQAVTPQPDQGDLAADFSLSVVPNAAVVQRNASITFNVTTARTAGMPGLEPIVRSASNLPRGVSASFNPPSVAADQSSVMTLTADATTVFNPGIVVVVTGSTTGVNGTFSHSKTIQMETFAGGGVGPEGDKGYNGDTGAAGRQRDRRPPHDPACQRRQRPQGRHRRPER